MSLNEIRRLVQQRPFKPLLFQLDNGTKQLLNHHEVIVTEVMIVSVDDDGQLIYIAPEAISTVRYAPLSNRRAKRGRRSNKPKR